MKKLTLIAFLLLSVCAFSQKAKPSVTAGADATAVAGTSVFLNATACDADGDIVKYAWTKQSGPASYKLSDATSLYTYVTGTVKGTYVFKITVTDKTGNTASSTATITVIPPVVTPPPTPPVNTAPRAYAGTNQTITLPENTVTLSGSGTDADGVITGYKWTKQAGNNATINTENSATTIVTGLSAGSHRFTLTVTDNANGTATDTLNVTVNPAIIVTPPPTNPPTTPPGSYGTLIYSTGYNSVADLDPYGNGQWGAGTLASHLSTSIFRDGPGCFKSVTASVSAGIRSEVQYPSSLTPTEGAIEYDVMYQTIFQNMGHSLQFHPNTSGGSASPGLWHENGKFVWVNWKGGTNTKYATNFAIPKGQWLHCVFEYKIGSNGYMKFTIDGKVVLDKTNIQVGDGSGQYLKVGVNMWQEQSSEVYYDNLKVWKK